VAAQAGPARFLATQLGTDVEPVIRWLVALLVMLIDPSAVVLTMAAACRSAPGWPQASRRSRVRAMAPWPLSKVDGRCPRSAMELF